MDALRDAVGGVPMDMWARLPAIGVAVVLTLRVRPAYAASLMAFLPGVIGCIAGTDAFSAASVACLPACHWSLVTRAPGVFASHTMLFWVIPLCTVLVAQVLGAPIVAIVVYVYMLAAWSWMRQVRSPSVAVFIISAIGCSTCTGWFLCAGVFVYRSTPLARAIMQPYANAVVCTLVVCALLTHPREHAGLERTRALMPTSAAALLMPSDDSADEAADERDLELARAGDTTLPPSRLGTYNLDTGMHRALAV
jgi:hypothetical protein